MVPTQVVLKTTFVMDVAAEPMWTVLVVTDQYSLLDSPSCSNGTTHHAANCFVHKSIHIADYYLAAAFLLLDRYNLSYCMYTSWQDFDLYILCISSLSNAENLLFSFLIK